MSPRALTPANQITILRLVFVPIFAIYTINGDYGYALVILLAAGVSDVVDGAIARVYHEVTPLGVALDPITDKILMTTAYVTLAFRGALPWWLTILVISRDAGMLLIALLIILVAGYRTFPPTLMGKASTLVQMVTLLAALAHQIHLSLVTQDLLTICVYGAATMTVASGLHYLLVLRQRYAPHDPEESDTNAA
jgi:cardiolipin synthase (CMP-forming)